MAYTLKLQAISQAEVGPKYHVGIGIPDPAGGGSEIVYGYCLVNDPQGGYFNEAIDVTARSQLLTASPELIDRDLVSFPRVTQGDFSGGIAQATMIDPLRCWDADLDLAVPGYAALQPQWIRVAAGTGATKAGPIIVAGGYVWAIFGDGAKLWHLTTNAAVASVVTAITPVYLCTDGTYVYYSDGGSNVYAMPIETGPELHTIAALNAGSIGQIWVMKQGTNGYWLYFLSQNALWRADITQNWPISTANQVQVPSGQSNIIVVDIAPFENGIAVLTRDLFRTDIGGPADATAAMGFDVSYSDGSSFTRIAHVDGYVPTGMVAVGSDLYITAQGYQSLEAPALIKINTSEVQIVARLNLPLSSQGIQTIGQPVTNGREVFFPISQSPLSGINFHGHAIFAYDVVTEVLTHLAGYGDGLDNPGGSLNLRNFTAYGETVVIPINNAGASSFQLLANTNLASSTIPKYQSAGWLVTSRYDFNTPSISKLIRRVIVEHSAIPAGGSVYVEAHVDQDPISFTTSLGPSPAGASVTNSTAGSMRTTLILPTATIGRSMFLAVKLTAGTGNAATPAIYDIATEVTTPWAWKMTLDCTSQRKNLTQADDTTEQGLRGRDLYWLLHTAWENALLITFYHPNGTSYQAVIEDLSFDSRTPMLGRPDVNRDDQDFDSYATLTLRQEVA